mmetsp:Transcript_71168/g.112733  ORF Transcript_71168/g.112733 Transcript_71168/m.112733 type:complete len:130 (+) Transcript_71168:54-443(+)
MAVPGCLAGFLGTAFVIPQRPAKGAARRMPPLVARAAEQEITKVEICIHRDCKRRGGGEKLKKQFEALAEGTGIEVAEYDCFDECPFGPNVRTLRGEEDQFGRVVNKVKGPKMIADILGVEPPDETAGA